MLPPYVFRQANLDAFDAIVRQVRRSVPTGARVVEWYAGVGVLGLSLAEDVRWVRCSDVQPPHAAFAASRMLLPHHLQRRITYARGAAHERIDDARGADTAIVDPPRKGLDAELLDALCGRHGACTDIRTLVYVSCGFPALTRDMASLLASGWCIRDNEATAYVLFPGANHIETVVVFERAGADREDAISTPADCTAPMGGAHAALKPEQPEPSILKLPRKQRQWSPTSPRARRLAKNKRARPRPRGAEGECERN